MFNYMPVTLQEAMQDRFQLLKEGIYDAVITASSDTQSKTGNLMLDMTVTVYDENGKTHDVRDFLVFTKQMMWKVVHFAESAGILKEYEAGKLCSQTAINRTVQVKIVVEQGSEIPQDKLKGKPLGTRYFDKNKIEDYIKKDDQKPLASNSSDDPFEDDDVAF